ncbi:MAG: class I SAM-dependent methyltransferase [Sandaracinaceae bacterium]|nr:class I SAM-dependent methyltransferase [Sandaracinaceae bacterium]
MRLSTLWSMLGGTAAPSWVRALGFMKPVHRSAWLAAASKHGVLSMLREEPRTLAELGEALGAPPARQPALRAWLTHGCVLGEIALEGERYRLRSLFARRLADPRFGEMKAFVEALAAIHHRGIYEALDHLKEGRSLGDLDHDLVARAAEMTAPVLREAIDRTVPRRGAATLLELGCGTGLHVRYACARNPELSAVGVEVDLEVAGKARAALREAALEARIRVETGDLRTLELDERFDVVTMFNLIYYFAVEERASVVARAASWLAPGGSLVLTTACGGETLPSNLLDIWFSSFRECGPLPRPPDITSALEAAGLEVARPVRMIPGEEYYLFVGKKPESPRLGA